MEPWDARLSLFCKVYSPPRLPLLSFSSKTVLHPLPTSPAPAEETASPGSPKEAGGSVGDWRRAGWAAPATGLNAGAPACGSERARVPAWGKGGRQQPQRARRGR